MFKITAEEKQMILKRRKKAEGARATSIPRELKNNPSIRNFQQDAKNLIKELKSEKVLRSGSIGMYNSSNRELFIDLTFTSPSYAEEFFFDELGPVIPRTWRKEETENSKKVRIIVNY